jgi:hypothetical protein
MGFMIRKASGELEEFRPEKVRQAVVRSGAPEALADDILESIDSQLYEGISTREIFRIVHQLLRTARPSLASKYDLKGAIMRLGPEGYAFETYISEVLREYGYTTTLRQFIKGTCVVHEIDVIAEKDGKRSAIECKYHNAKGLTTGLKEAMYTYARLLDLNEGCKQGHCPHFDDIWLVTNTRLSLDAIQYAQCKELKLLGWRHPPEGTLEHMIESKGLYPITILKSVDRHAKEGLFSANMMLAKDLLDNDFEGLLQKTKLPRGKLEEIIGETRQFYQNS